MPPDELKKLSIDEKRALLESKLRERAARKTLELPLSHGQKALFFTHRVAPKSPAYNVILAGRILSPLDTEALRSAFQGLADRHLALRTSFAIRDGEPVAVVPEKVEAPFEVLDRTTASPGELLDELREEVNRPFDLLRGPLFRARVYRGAEHPFLVSTFHHIVMDGWSLWICLEDLAALYGAALRGAKPPLEKVRHDFRTYLRFQDQLLAGAEGRRQRDFWKEALSDGAPALELPADKVRPPARRFRGASHRFRLERHVTEKLKKVAAADGATLPMAALALLQVLLSRWSSQEEFVLGTVATGRSRPELEDVVGYLANPLAIRATVPRGATFRRVLEETRASMLEVFDRQDYPLSLLLPEVAPARDPSRSALFDVLFVFEKSQGLDPDGVASFIVGESGRRMEVGELALESLPVTAQHEGQFDLVFLAAEIDGRLEGYLDYSTDLFEEATIRRMAKHFVTLTKAAIASPEAPVSDLDMLTPAETSELEAWNDTAIDCAPRCLHELFESQVELHPDLPAAVFEGTALSYRELDERANRLARYLRKLGVERETRVGLAVERSLDLVVGVLGVSKAGAAFVPLDPSYPKDRLSFMLSDSSAPILLTQSSLVEDLPAYEGRVVLLDESPAPYDSESSENPHYPAESSQLAYVIYTSGSTGRPKGTLVEHSGLASLSHEQKRLFGAGPGSRVLQFASLSFDAAVFELVMALGSGGSLHLGRAESLLPGAPLLEKIRSEAIQIVTLPPSALMSTPLAELPSLETITVAGEACPAELVARWAPGRRFFNLYGPTECTIWSTYAECRDGTKAPPIGKPIGNTTAHVLDSNLTPVPVGVRGELYIGGVALARGYVGQPELTASRFIADPFSEETGARLYRTGDLVRRRPDGDIEYLGRVDFQVKIRGFRIELGEIEEVLLRHEAVAEVAVAAREDSPGDKRIVAYLVPVSSPVDRAGLKRFLKNHLPDFMVPNAFVWIDALPRMPSGKVDRGKLPAPSSEPRPLSENDAPRNALEDTVLTIWKDVLHVASIGVHDNFFDLGGNSLLMARVNAKLTEVVGKELPIVEMFKFPTVHALAGRLSEPPEEQAEAEPAELRGRVRTSSKELLERQAARRARARTERRKN